MPQLRSAIRASSEQARRVWTECDLVDRPGMAGEREQLPVAGRVPEARGSILAGGHDQPRVCRESCRQQAVAVGFGDRLEQWMTWIRSVPKPCRAVLAGGQNQLVVGAEHGAMEILATMGVRRLRERCDR